MCESVEGQVFILTKIHFIRRILSNPTCRDRVIEILNQKIENMNSRIELIENT